MTRATAAALAIALGIALTLTGCISSGRSAEPGYTPAADAELLAEIRDLPHVTDVEMTSQEPNFTNGAGYTVKLTTDGTVNPYLVIDQTAAILRQGYEIAGLFVWVPNEDPTLGINDAYALRDLLDDLLGPGASDPLRQRYGPQPGEGTPPAGTPAPTPPGWTPAPSPSPSS